MRPVFWFLMAIYLIVASATEFGQDRTAAGVIAALGAAVAAVLLFLEFDPGEGESR